MSDTIRIKRRATGAAGPPASLANAEVAYNEVDDVLYYGKGGAPAAAASVVPIAGSGAFALKSELAASYQPLDADLTALAGLTGTNVIYYRSAANTWAAVTIGTGLTFSGGTLAATGAGAGNVISVGTPTNGQLAQWTDATHIQGIAASSLGFAPLASPTFTGDPKAPTAAPGDADTSIATTAFVANAVTAAGAGYQPADPDLTSLAAASATDAIYYRSAANTWSPITLETGSMSFSGGVLSATVEEAGTGGVVYGRQTGGWADLSLIFATLASPVFTGDPRAPTPATSDNDTSIATTAFVKAQGYLVSSDLSGYAPTTAQYITATTDAALANERVLTDTATIAWDAATAGQMKANVVTSANYVWTGTHQFGNLVGIGIAPNASYPLLVHAETNGNLAITGYSAGTGVQFRALNDALTINQVMEFVGAGYEFGSGGGVIIKSTNATIGIGSGALVVSGGASVAGTINVGRTDIRGSSSGVVSIAAQAAAGTYNFNLPTAPGTSGQVLTSGGGGSSPMTWSAVQPLDGDLTSLAAASSVAIYYRSAADTWAPVTIGTGLSFSGGTLSATATGGAPTTVEYITAATDATLTNERVLTNTATVTWDFSTPGQAKANTAAGGGNVSNSGTPTNGQWARWTSATTIEGVAAASTGFVQKSGDTMTGKLTVNISTASADNITLGGSSNVGVHYTPASGATTAAWTYQLGNVFHISSDTVDIINVDLAAAVASLNATPAAGDNSTKIATTAFVNTALATMAPINGRLTYVGATQLKFAPFNGNKIKINGTLYTIPNAGLPGLANTGIFLNNAGGASLAANTTYWVFAFLNGGVPTGHFWSVAGGLAAPHHAPSQAVGNEGVEVFYNGTFLEAFSLIGMVRTNASAQFVDSAAVRGVLSWFNRRRRIAQGRFTADRSTASATMVEINSEIAVGFLTWIEDSVLLGTTGLMIGGTASTTGYTRIAVDGALLDGGVAYTVPTAGFAGPIGMTAAYGGLNAMTEGYHTATLYGKASSGSFTWAGASGTFPDGACTLSAQILG